MQDGKVIEARGILTAASPAQAALILAEKGCYARELRRADQNDERLEALRRLSGGTGPEVLASSAEPVNRLIRTHGRRRRGRHRHVLLLVLAASVLALITLLTMEEQGWHTW